MLAAAQPDTATRQETRPVRLLEELTDPDGWQFTLDPDRQETAAERRTRYLADTRLVDMHGFALIVKRSYISVKDMKYESDAYRRIVAANRVDEDTYQTLAADIDRAHAAGATVDDLQPLLAELQALDQRRLRFDLAHDKLLKAMPERRTRGGQSPMWYAADAFRFGRRTGRLDEWYEHAVLKQTGRPYGSRNQRH